MLKMEVYRGKEDPSSAGVGHINAKAIVGDQLANEIKDESQDLEHGQQITRGAWARDYKGDADL